jgi:hypothetical protein
MFRTNRRAPLLAVAACILALGPTAARAQDTQADDSVTVTVANRNWLDMHIYLSQANSTLSPLAVVGANQTEELSVPRHFFNGTDVRLVADPIGGNGIYVSDVIIASPGDELYLTLENALPLSFLSVRPHRRT